MNLLLIGAQGSGKGTQAQLLADEFQLKACASGELLRDAIAHGTPSGLKARPYYDCGDLVPDDIVVAMILEGITSINGKRGVLLDGFPRTLAQARALDTQLAQTGQTIDSAIYLDVPRAVLTDRLSGRYICQEHGHVWNIKTRPPRRPGVCDFDGSPLFQRSDDTGEAVNHRLDIFFNETIHVVQHYEAQGRLLRVDGTQSIEAVNRFILNGLKGWGMTPVVAQAEQQRIDQ